MLDEVESFKMSRLLPFFGMNIDKILKNADENGEFIVDKEYQIIDKTKLL